MSINIPSYYYTDITKHIKGESFETIRAKVSKARTNFANTNVHLDLSKAINLSSSNKQSLNSLSDETIKHIEEVKKKLGKINFSETEKTCPDYEITVMNREGRPLDYYNFRNCVNSITELSDTEKTTLRNAIITSTESVQGQQQDNTTFGMRISQTNMELKYISQKLIPEKYQDQFNLIADKCTDELSDRYTNILMIFDTAFANSTDKTLIATGLTKKAKESLDSLNNGTDLFHTSMKYYNDLYKNVDLTNDVKLKEGLSSVYANFTKNNELYTNSTSPVDQGGLSREVKYLNEKWNALIDVMNGSSSLKFLTSLNCIG